VAVALGYAADRDAAPRILAKGQGAVARRILEIAEKNGVPIRGDMDLAEMLAGLDLGEMIPPEFYPAVAEVLAFIYRRNQERPLPEPKSRSSARSAAGRRRAPGRPEGRSPHDSP